MDDSQVHTVGPLTVPVNLPPNRQQKACWVILKLAPPFWSKLFLSKRCLLHLWCQILHAGSSQQLTALHLAESLPSGKNMLACMGVGWSPGFHMLQDNHSLSLLAGLSSWGYIAQFFLIHVLISSSTIQSAALLWALFSLSLLASTSTGSDVILWLHFLICPTWVFDSKAARV